MENTDNGGECKDHSFSSLIGKSAKRGEDNRLGGHAPKAEVTWI